MITLVGVGHVFAISDRVKELIREKHPEVVCLELDMGRYAALLSRDENRPVPLQYRLLAYFQKRMAKQYGTEVGHEMVAAAEAASEIGAKVALIDMDAATVLTRMWSRMTMRERFKLLTGSVMGLFASKEMVEREVEKYEQQEESYLENLADQFPSVKQVLIDDRNRHMADKIRKIASEHRDVLAVIGDGHIQGVSACLTPLEVETHRLKDIRNAEPAPYATSEYTASYWYRS
jgi:pheromone shutdown protein TraB